MLKEKKEALKKDLKHLRTVKERHEMTQKLGNIHIGKAERKRIDAKAEKIKGADYHFDSGLLIFKESCLRERMFLAFNYAEKKKYLEEIKKLKRDVKILKDAGYTEDEAASLIDDIERVEDKLHLPFKQLKWETELDNERLEEVVKFMKKFEESLAAQQLNAAVEMGVAAGLDFGKRAKEAVSKFGKVVQNQAQPAPQPQSQPQVATQPQGAPQQAAPQMPPYMAQAMQQGMVPPHPQAQPNRPTSNAGDTGVIFPGINGTPAPQAAPQQQAETKKSKPKKKKKAKVKEKEKEAEAKKQTKTEKRLDKAAENLAAAVGKQNPLPPGLSEEYLREMAPEFIKAAVAAAGKSGSMAKPFTMDPVRK